MRAMVLLLLAAAIGCGSEGSRVPVYPVAGAVAVGGKPAAGARVVFHRAGPAGDPAAPVPFAVAGPDGAFAVTSYAAGDGAAEGEYAVTVTWPRPGGPKDGDDAYDGSAPPDQLRGKFADPAKTPLRATVARGGTKLDPFRLD